jgi:hypothetical protein
VTGFREPEDDLAVPVNGLGRGRGAWRIVSGGGKSRSEGRRRGSASG